MAADEFDRIVAEYVDVCRRTFPHTAHNDAAKLTMFTAEDEASRKIESLAQPCPFCGGVDLAFYTRDSGVRFLVNAHERYMPGQFGRVTCAECNAQATGRPVLDDAKTPHNQDVERLAYAVRAWNRRAAIQPESFALLQPQRVSDTQPVAVSQSYTLLDARKVPPPRGMKIICGSTKSGTTVIGHYDPNGIVGHDCWLPMPGFPDSLKKRR